MLVLRMAVHLYHEEEGVGVYSDINANTYVIIDLIMS